MASAKASRPLNSAELFSLTVKYNESQVTHFQTIELFDCCCIKR